MNVISRPALTTVGIAKLLRVCNIAPDGYRRYMEIAEELERTVVKDDQRDIHILILTAEPSVRSLADAPLMPVLTEEVVLWEQADWVRMPSIS